MRHALTDGQWSRLLPHLPPQQSRTVRPNRDHRPIVNVLLCRLRTGAPWRDLPERFGPWRTVYSRFRRWQRVGVREHVLAALQATDDAAGMLSERRHLGVLAGGRHRDRLGEPRGAGVFYGQACAVAARRTSSSLAMNVLSRKRCGL